MKGQRRATKRWLALGVTFAVSTCHPSLVYCQSSSDRIALDHLRDSLSATSDASALRFLQRTLQKISKQRPDSAEIHLRLAHVSLRLGRLGADADMGDALRSFRKATALRPDWPQAWYGLGLAREERSAWERANPLALGNRIGTGGLERAARDYRRALRADPGFAMAALALAEVTLALRDTALFGPARESLRAAVGAARQPVPELLLAWGRIERAAAEPDSAAAAFERFLTAGGDRGAGLLELARTRLAGGRPGGEATYFEGAAQEDSATVAGYRADLAPIAPDSVLALYDRARGEDRAGFLRRFWSDRDGLELREQGERLREHYRRLLHARRHFALTVSRRFYGRRDAYRSGSEEIDDRGVIYVRHGEPAERLRPFVFGLMPNESWRYARAEGDLLFHFSAGWDENGGGDLYDYRLVESVFDLRGAARAPVDQLLLSRNRLSPEYGRMLTWGSHGVAGARARERGMGYASIEFGTTTDSYELQFGRRLMAVADLVAVGGGPEKRLAHLVFAVGQPGTEPALENGSASYAVRVRLVALDGNDRPFARLDTTLVVRPRRPRQEDQYLIGRVEIPLPAGFWSWRAVLQQGDDAGIVLPRDSVRVGPGGPALALSDVVLGDRQAGAVWLPTPADTVYLTPFDLFREGSEVQLYYELSGASPDASYRHEIAVFKSKDDRGTVERRPVVTLAFEEQALEPVVRSSRTLQLGRLKPGRYVVEVRVTGSDGRAELRRRAFRVVKRE